MGQQFYVIRRMPAPGSPAEKALEERRLKKGQEHKRFTIPGLHAETPAAEPAAEPEKPRTGQRQQPKRKSRQKPSTAPQGDAKAPEASVAERDA